MEDINTKIIKKIIDTVPVTGDKIVSINNSCAVYSSGGKIEIPNTSRLEIGDAVTGVYHGQVKKNNDISIYIIVYHLGTQSVTECNPYSEYLKAERIFKIKDILS